MAKATKKKKKGGGKGGVLVLLIGGAAAAGYFLRDCMPNWGMGGGSGKGDATQTASETPETKPPGDRGTVSVVVKGEQCSLGTQTLPCPEACASIKQAHKPADSRVEVDSTTGAHEVVEQFGTCLKDAGFTVDVRSQ